MNKRWKACWKGFQPHKEIVQILDAFLGSEKVKKS
mgnify:FL=1